MENKTKELIAKKIAFKKYEDRKTILFHQISLQTNQNSLAMGCFPPTTKTLNYLHQNYMFQSILFHKPVSQKSYIFREIMGSPKKSKIQKINITKKAFMRPLRESKIKSDGMKFNYQLRLVKAFRSEVEMVTNCSWLDFRLGIHEVMNDENISLDHLKLQLKSTMVYTAMDIMIYHHTKSDFALQLFKKESHNLLLILKIPALESVVKYLQDGFSPLLLTLMKASQDVEATEEVLSRSLMDTAEIIIKNYNMIDLTKDFTKGNKKNKPKLLYYSFCAPASMVNDGKTINKALDNKMISLQRKFNCKIIVNGPFLRNLSPATRNEFYRFEIFFDYYVNCWTAVIQEFIRWMKSFPRCCMECQIDQVCISYISKEFSYFDEIKNLIKRQHELREVDTNFIKLVEWMKLKQVDRLII